MSLPTSTQGCRPWFLGDGHRHGPMPSGMRVGRQPRPRLCPNRALVKTDQRNAASAPVKNPGPSPTGGLATVPPGDNNSKAKSKKSPSPMWPTPKCQFPPQRGLTARRSPSLWRALRPLRPYTTHSDSNEFVREVLTLIHVRRLASYSLPFIHVFLFLVVRLVGPIHHSWVDFGRNIVRGRSVRRRRCLFAVAYLLPCLPSSHSHSLPTPPSQIPMHFMLQRDISVHASSRDVSHLH